MSRFCLFDSPTLLKKHYDHNYQRDHIREIPHFGSMRREALKAAWTAREDGPRGASRGHASAVLRLVHFVIIERSFQCG